MKKYFSVYNIEKHLHDDPGNVGPIDDKITDDVMNQRETTDDIGRVTGTEEFKVGEINSAAQRKHMLDLECIGRGTLNGEWKTYMGDAPFSWDAVTPKKVVKK